jgi:hypothetical protein
MIPLMESFTCKCTERNQVTASPHEPRSTNLLFPAIGADPHIINPANSRPPQPLNQDIVTTDIASCLVNSLRFHSRPTDKVARSFLVAQGGPAQTTQKQTHSLILRIDPGKIAPAVLHHTSNSRSCRIMRRRMMGDIDQWLVLESSALLQEHDLHRLPTASQPANLLGFLWQWPPPI